MTTRGRPLARYVLLAGVLFTGAAARPAPSAASPSPKPDADRHARIDLLRPPEVRLRKLHLVRPDLIPYPLSYEVYC